MKRKQASLTMIGCLAALCWAPPARAQDELILSVAVGSEAVMPGDTVTVTLEVANLSAAINGLQARLHYDSALLALDAVVPTNLGLDPPAQGWEVIVVDDVGGDLTYAAVVLVDSQGGDGSAATLTFTAIEEGATRVTFLADSDPFFTKLTVAADNSTILPNKVDSGLIVIDCDDDLFCTGEESLVDGVCVSAGDPCFPLVCDEVNDVCLAPGHVANLELFYAGRFGICVGGDDDGMFCSDEDDCRNGTCDLSAPLADPSRTFLASGSTATIDNISNYMRGITGIRVFFDNLVEFATTPFDAFSFAWTPDTGGTTFSPVTDPGNITVTADDGSGVTVVTIVLADDHVRRRWLKVTIDATQVTVDGVELDGELVGNPVQFPSGDDVPGGDSVFHLGNITGDVDLDRITTLTDIGLIRSEVNPFVSVPITNVFDVDKDGVVLLGEVGDARADVNPFFELPLLTP